MFALDLLRIALAEAVDFGREVPFVSAPVVGIVARDTKGREQRLQLQKYLVLTPADVEILGVSALFLQNHTLRKKRGGQENVRSRFSRAFVAALGEVAKVNSRLV